METLYSAVVALRGRAFDSGMLRSHRLGIPVISVGNLTTGGTGKSPLVAWIARALAREGRRPVVVSRGYLGSHRGPSTIVSDGRTPLIGAAEAGDEPVMLAQQLAAPEGGVPVIVSRRRLEGGRRGISDFRAGCVILDDGFQHRALQRDLDLLLLDGAAPFGNGRLLPAGPLREPLSALRRAGAVVITRPDDRGDGKRSVQEALSRCRSVAPVFQARLVPSGLRDVNASSSGSLGHLKGARVFCFAGIARPEVFFRDVAALGAEIAGTASFRDHHPFTPEDIDRLSGSAFRARADLLLTTEKDAVRIGPDRLPALYAVAIEARPEEEAELTRLILGAVS